MTTALTREPPVSSTVLPPTEAAERGAVRGTVVLLHGLGANSWLMWPLASRLQKRGFATQNWGYWSVGESLASLVPHFREKLRRLQDARQDDHPLYLVGHSLGSIISRGVLAEAEFPAVKRLVMICPPNRGSRVAATVGPYLRWLTPLVDELADGEGSLVNQLPQSLTADIGVIAAGSDRVVHERNTHLATEADHIVLPGMHGDLIFRSSVALQVDHFLTHGRFCRADLGSVGESEKRSERRG